MPPKTDEIKNEKYHQNLEEYIIPNPPFFKYLYNK